MRAHHTPETLEGLSWTRPPREQGFDLIFEFELDRKKRPGRDDAPCPICSNGSPKYLQGALAWYPLEGVYRAIGRDCSSHYVGKAVTEKALREYKERLRHRANFEFATANLGSVPAMRRYFADLLPLAQQAEGLISALGAAHVRSHIRMTLKGTGRLILYEQKYVEAVVAGELRVVKETVPIDFGILSGADAIDSNYKAVKAIRIEDNRLAAIDFGEGEAAEAVSRLGYAHASDLDMIRKAIIQAHRSQAKLKNHIEGVFSFFSPENIEVLGRFGAHKENENRFFAIVDRDGFRFGVDGKKLVRVKSPENALRRLPPWPTIFLTTEAS